MKFFARIRRPDFSVGNYLRRWWVIPRNRFANVYFHKINESDGQHVHDHPWWNVSIILRGCYREHLHDGTARIRRPGHIIFRSALQLHRLEVIEGPVYTLFITGRHRRHWGFMTPTGWVPWEDYTGPRGRGGLL